jgi:hypothetical protein
MIFHHISAKLRKIWHRRTHATSSGISSAFHDVLKLDPRQFKWRRLARPDQQHAFCRSPARKTKHKSAANGQRRGRAVTVFRIDLICETGLIAAFAKAKGPVRVIFHGTHDVDP